MRLNAVEYGTKDSLEFKNRESIRALCGDGELFVMHNHPGNKSFSLNDIEFFLSHDSVKHLSIAKNNGDIEVISKIGSYNCDKVKIALKRALKNNVNNSTNEEYDKAVKEFFKKSKDGGLIWKKTT